MILPADLRARDLTIELFEAATIMALQDELQAWLSTRTEEVIIAIDFSADVATSADDASYRASVIYTE